jgi:hypothetical protein
MMNLREEKVPEMSVIVYSKTVIIPSTLKFLGSEHAVQACQF